jgi:hypothetical protein
MNGDEIFVFHGADSFRFLVEASQCLNFSGDIAVENFQCVNFIECFMFYFIYASHAASANQAENLIFAADIVKSFERMGESCLSCFEFDSGGVFGVSIDGINGTDATGHETSAIRTSKFELGSFCLFLWHLQFWLDGCYCCSPDQDISVVIGLELLCSRNIFVVTFLAKAVDYCLREMESILCIQRVGSVTRYLSGSECGVGSAIEVNDTLQLTREQGFPCNILNRATHVSSPIATESVSDRIFAFEKDDARLFHLDPVRVFLVENIKGKWLFWGKALIQSQTIRKKLEADGSWCEGSWMTVGTFKIIDLYDPQYQEAFTKKECPRGKSYL